LKNVFADKDLRPLFTENNGRHEGWVKGLEPSTSRSTVCEQHDASEDHKGLATTPSPVCTRVCTSEPEIANAATLDANQSDATGGADQDQGDPLAKLAATLLALSPADRAKLAAMLTEQEVEDGTKTAPPPAGGSFEVGKANRGSVGSPPAGGPPSPW
jgi:hypothetical protein